MNKVKMLFAALLFSAIPVPVLANPIQVVEPTVEFTVEPTGKPTVELANSELAVPTSSSPTPTPDALFEYIQQLEARQQKLEEEIEQLRQQLEHQNAQIESNDQDSDTAVAEEEETAAETEIAAAEEDPMGLDVAVEITNFNPKTTGLLDFAVAGPGVATAIDGNIATIDYEPNEALRYAANIRFADSPIDVGFVTSNASSQGNASVSAPPGGLLFATLTNPSQGERAESADASSTLAYSLTDIEVGYSLDLGSAATTRLYGGIRFADLSQDTDVRYDGQDFSNALVSSERDFNGIGLLAGSETKLALGSGFSLFGQAGGALLIGDASFTQRETNISGNETVVDINRVSSSRVVPMLELAAGVNWLSDIGDDAQLDVTFGYSVEQWFNVLDSIRFVDSSGTGVLTQDTSNLSSSGLFVELGINFDF